MQQVAQMEKSCLKGKKVARNMKTCQKVAEQLVVSPIATTFPLANAGLRWRPVHSPFLPCIQLSKKNTKKRGL